MTKGSVLEKESGLEKAKKLLAGKKALVVGLASTGVSASRFLAKCGAVVTATDMKQLEALPEANGLIGLGIKVVTGGHAGITFEGGELVVVSPGVPYDVELLQAARKAGAEVISDIELAYMFVDAPVLAIAGTNGKTTTTTLLGQVLEDAGKKAFVGGNIGTPAIEYVENGGGAGLCVWEISSFHLETTKTFNPHIGILLNITEDHLDRYRDFGHYAETKFRLFENQSEGDYAIVNANDPVIAQWLKKGLTKGKVVPFTVNGALEFGLYYKDNTIFCNLGNGVEIYPAEGFGLRGLHNMENIMAVIAASRLSGITRDELISTLKSFKGLSHRMELVKVIDGVSYIDDSKGTNIGALEMALRGLSGNVILIAGGKDKGGDYRVLTPLIKEKVKLMVLLGEARFKIREALGALTETIIVDSLEDAVKVSHRRAAAGDTVLLSPACSSFDMFKSYKDRGDKFKAYVGAL